MEWPDGLSSRGRKKGIWFGRGSDNVARLPSVSLGVLMNTLSFLGLDDALLAQLLVLYDTLLVLLALDDALLPFLGLDYAFLTGLPVLDDDLLVKLFVLGVAARRSLARTWGNLSQLSWGPGGNVTSHWGLGETSHIFHGVLGKLLTFLGNLLVGLGKL